jgi:hypothetical protein
MLLNRRKKYVRWQTFYSPILIGSRITINHLKISELIGYLKNNQSTEGWGGGGSSTRKKVPNHIHNGVLFSHKKNEITSFAGKWMELEIKLSKTGEVQKDKYCMFLVICRI